MPFQGVARIATEWLTGNASRAYPLADETGGVSGTLPCRLLLDALLTCCGGIDTEHVWISRLTRARSSLTLELSGIREGATVQLGVISDIPMNTPEYTTVPVNIRGENYLLTGSLVVGDLSAVSELPADMTLTESQGRLFPGCVRSEDEWVAGIRVDDTIYTGIVNLVAGDGITLTPTTENGITTITIAATAYTMPPENLVITSDAELLANAVEAYGRPIRRISGVYPNTEGNIALVSEESETDDGDKFSAIAVGDSGALKLIDATSNAGCCVDNTVDNLMTDIARLNDRATRIDTAITTLDTAINTMNLQLAKLS